MHMCENFEVSYKNILGFYWHKCEQNEKKNKYVYQIENNIDCTSNLTPYA